MCRAVWKHIAAPKLMQSRRASLVQRLQEARRRLIYTGVAFAVGILLTLVLYQPLVKVLILPAEGRLSPTSKPVVINVTESMAVTFKLAALGGIVVATPMLTYQIILFLAPALKPKVRRLLLLLIPVALLSCAIGVLFGYYVVVPPLIQFSLSFGTNIATPMIRWSDYVNFILTLLFGVGLTFETPLVMFVLALLRIVSYRAFWRFWRYILVLSFVIGAIFDPSPNPLDQIIVAGCIIVLYGVGIGLAWLVRPRDVQAERLT